MPDFESLIRQGRGTRSLEYKSGQPWDALKNHIARTAMAMANLQDGGTIVIGVTQTRGEFTPTGVLPEDAASFTDDAVQAHVNRFATPHVALRVDAERLDDRLFVVVSIDEFHAVPVICAQDGGTPADGLRRGTIYVRSTRQTETAAVATAEEMRAILDLAMTKQLDEFRRQLSRIALVELTSEWPMSPGFDEQLEGI